MGVGMENPTPVQNFTYLMYMLSGIVFCVDVCTVCEAWTKSGAHTVLLGLLPLPSSRSVHLPTSNTCPCSDKYILVSLFMYMYM